MEGIRNTSAFARLAASSLVVEKMKLVDVGCWGGIDPGWREFGDRLSALAFDCVEAEIARLAAAEANPAIRYVMGMVGLPDDHPIRGRKAAPTPLHRWPGGRLSNQRTNHIRDAKSRGERPLELGEYLKSVVHAGAPDPSDGFDTDYARVDAYSGAAPAEIVYLPAYLEENGFGDLDFLKIDVDGPDFDILRGMDRYLADPGLLGVAVEVNFVGSHDANDHSFHNVDRLMRSAGFDLFSLTVRRYSSAALPWPYQDAEPALTTGGRPVQGDALYMRDLSSPIHKATAAAVSDEKLLKLAAMFALVNLPDEAAEVLLIHRERLERLIDVDAGLDLLALEIQETDGTSLSYRDYVAAFEAEAPQIMNQNGRSAAWLQMLKDSHADLAAANRRISELQAALAASRPAEVKAEPFVPRGLRRLFS